MKIKGWHCHCGVAQRPNYIKRCPSCKADIVPIVSLPEVIAWIRERGAEEGKIGDDAVGEDLEYEAMRRTGCEDMANDLADHLQAMIEETAK